MSSEPTPEARLDDYERRFRRAGLPLFIEDFSAASDVFNRAVPLLALVFGAEMLGAIQLDWPLAANAAAALGGLAILLVGLGLANRRRGRPFGSVPEDVGRLEPAGFVLLPAVLPLLFGGQWRSAAVTAAANLLLLALVYGVVGFGLISILRWVLSRLARQLLASVALLARAVPLLMIFALLAFVNTEMWQVFSEVPAAGLVEIGLLFVVLGAAFLIARPSREVGELDREVGDRERPLRRPQRLNVGLVLFVSQAVQVLTVSLMVAAFFVVFGAVAVTEAVRESWIGSAGDVLVTIELSGEPIQITGELLRVAGGPAAFSGLYFAVAMLTDSTYREEFLDELTAEMRQSFRARSEYLSLRGAG